MMRTPVESGGLRPRRTGRRLLWVVLVVLALEVAWMGLGVPLLRPGTEEEMLAPILLGGIIALLAGLVVTGRSKWLLVLAGLGATWLLISHLTMAHYLSGTKRAVAAPEVLFDVAMNQEGEEFNTFEGARPTGNQCQVHIALPSQVRPLPLFPYFSWMSFKFGNSWRAYVGEKGEGVGFGRATIFFSDGDVDLVRIFGITWVAPSTGGQLREAILTVCGKSEAQYQARSEAELRRRIVEET